jgi:ribosome-binding ATPase YchF (GTP1/OBG family)
VKFLEEEITAWTLAIVQKDWKRIVGRVRAEGAKLDELLLEKLSGLKISRGHILKAVRDTGLKAESADNWTEEEMKNFVRTLQRIAKPIIIAANKIDRPNSEKNFKRLQETFPELLVVPVSALAEKALKDLDKKGIIRYILR